MSEIPDIEPFAGEGLHGEVVRDLGLEDPVAEARRITDPAAAGSTVHWGRNYLYAASLHAADGAVEVVVKQFKNQGLRRRVERRVKGSKAGRSWHGARALQVAGVPTPAPLMLIESDAAAGASFFVTERLRESYEVRHFFRRLAGDPSAGAFPEVEPEALLEALGGLARRMHDGGVLHRDLSMGNVLAVPNGGELELYVVDTNRVRRVEDPGTVRRVRDSCRLPILEPEHRDAFLRGYWGDPPATWSPRRWLWAVSVRGYLAKHAVKNRLRGIRLRRRHAHGGSHHPHIPPAEPGAARRDRTVWDPLSDQPHQHAGRAAKLAIRLADAPAHAAGLARMMAAAPEVRRRYRRLAAGLYREPTPFTGVGVALRPSVSDPDAQLDLLDELGVRRVMLRLHPWEDDHRAEEAFAEECAGRGLEVSFALPQNRDLVRDPARWRAAVEEIGERFVRHGSVFQVGQAPNRSKWGIWTLDEYLRLLREASTVLRRYQGVELIGPAVIDFELQTTLSLLRRRVEDVHLDAVSSLLYVDRRGAPENRQLGFDTVGKVLLLRAIAESGRWSSPRCWITEVNWPLWEGPHSPAGRSVSVDEETQADHLVRYYLLVLGTGLVERVFWWQLVARGYGLAVADSTGRLRRRPSFEALRTLRRELEGSSFLGPLPSDDGTFLYRFRRTDDELVVGWSLAPGAKARLPRPPAEARDRDGRVVPIPSSVDVDLGPSPTYYLLQPE